MGIINLWLKRRNKGIINLWFKRRKKGIINLWLKRRKKKKCIPMQTIHVVLLYKVGYGGE